MKPRLVMLAIFCLVGGGRLTEAQSVSYTLRADAADLSKFDVTMRIADPPKSLRLAMAAHPEYNERFWRQVRDLRIAGSGTPTIERVDSSLWLVRNASAPLTISYSLVLPPSEGSMRGAWKPFLSSSGGLIGGIDSFMYLPDQNVRDIRITLDVPREWKIATALGRVDSVSFVAADQLTLVDSPILVGKLSLWEFTAGGVKHHVAYLRSSASNAFDSVAFVTGVERLADRAIALFHGAPYKEFTFLFQDAAYGGLEHLNSVTLGAPSEDLAADAGSMLEETAHEFFHSWNLMRIHPVERGTLDYRPNGRTSGLWFAEGLSLFYADLLLRRAGLKVSDSTRIAHLEQLIQRYLFNSGNTRISPERVSLAEYADDAASLGDYTPSTHLQGELLGTALDLTIRRATGGGRSIDDLMRLMLAGHSSLRGYTGTDIEGAAEEVCGCDMRRFFDSHVRGAIPLDFNQYLAAIGMRVSVSWTPALNDSGEREIDYRIWARPSESGTDMVLRVMDPESIWSRSGIHSGDILVSFAGKRVATANDFRQAFRMLRIGARIPVEVVRRGRKVKTFVVVTGYQKPVVRILGRVDATPAQLALRTRWIEGQ